MPFDLDHALRYLIAAEGSDLHLKVPAYPLVRLHGKLEPIVGDERLTPQDTERVLQEMLNDPEAREASRSHPPAAGAQAAAGACRSRGRWLSISTTPFATSSRWRAPTST